MKWLRVAKKDPIVDAAPLIVEAKGERAKIRQLRERLEKEDKASEISALSAAIDALESRMEKDQARREKRKLEKAEKAKAKAAEPKAEPAKEVEAAGRRAPVINDEDEANIELDLDGLDGVDDDLLHHQLNEEDDDGDLGNPMKVLPGDIVSIDLPSQGGALVVEVDMTGDKPEILSVSQNGIQFEDDDLAGLLSDEEFMADVEHAAIAKAHPAGSEELAEEPEMMMDALPAALLDQMAAVTASIESSWDMMRDPQEIVVLQAQVGSLGDRYPGQGRVIGGLYNALDLCYRHLMERIAAEGGDNKDDKENDMPAEDKKDTKKDAPESDSKAPEKKDDKSDKKAPPFGDKKKDAPAKKPDSAPKKHDESEDIHDAGEAIKMIEDLLKKEKADGEGGAHTGELEKALQLLKKFVGEEGAEEDDADMFKAPSSPKGPAKLPMAPMKMEILPPAGGPAKGPAMPPAGGPPKPPMKGMPAAANPWLGVVSGLEIGARVWRKAMVGSVEYVGDESGRVVAHEGADVAVDFGDEEPVLCSPSELVIVEAQDGEADVFVQAPDLGSSDEAAVEERTAAEEANAILSTLSLKDMLVNQTEVDEDAIVHIASGKVGKFIAEGSDGRVTISVEGRTMTVWPHEIDQPDIAGGTGGLFE